MGFLKNMMKCLNTQEVGWPLQWILLPQSPGEKGCIAWINDFSAHPLFSLIIFDEKCFDATYCWSLLCLTIDIGFSQIPKLYYEASFNSFVLHLHKPSLNVLSSFFSLSSYRHSPSSVISCSSSATRWCLEAGNTWSPWYIPQRTRYSLNCSPSSWTMSS